MNRKILVIQPDETVASLLTHQLIDLNYKGGDIYRCHTLQESASFSDKGIDLIFADVAHGKEGITSSLAGLKRNFSDAPVVILSDNNDIETYVETIRNGGQCLLVNGTFDKEQLDKAINVAIERNEMLIKAKELSSDYERHFANGPIPMWIVDEKTMGFLVVNDATVDKYGYSKEEFTKMTILDIRPEEDIEATRQKYQEREGKYYDAGYWRHRKKSGEVFHVHVYSHATSFGNKPARLVFIVDVNEKMIADQKNRELHELVKEQKERLDGILSSINDAIWSRDAVTYELVYANNAYYQLYGYEPGTNEPDKSLDISSIFPNDREIFYEAVSEVKTTGKTELIYRYVGKDGTIKTLKANAVYKKGLNGKPDTIDGVTIDITKEKELYDQIRNSEQKLSTTINNTKDLIWSVDQDLKITFCNKAFQDFFMKLGIALDEGDSVLGDWRSDSFILKRKQEYERALAGESFITLLEENLASETLYFEISSSPVFDVDDKVIGVNCVSRDITDQEKKSMQIQHQNEMLKEIAWIQSHKVRGPVASILGLLSLIDHNEIKDKHNQEILENLKIATNDLDTIIKEIVSKTRDVDPSLPEPESSL